MFKTLAFITIGLTCGFGLCALLNRPQGWISTASVAPDASSRIAIFERQRRLGRIDRNFDIQLTPLAMSRLDEPVVIFRSPDEGFPIGTERFVWSSDSDWALLVGQHFSVVPEAPRGENGEAAYALIQVSTKAVWCNASQASGPRFDVDRLRAAGIFWPAASPPQP